MYIHTYASLLIIQILERDGNYYYQLDMKTYDLGIGIIRIIKIKLNTKPTGKPLVVILDVSVL